MYKVQQHFDDQPVISFSLPYSDWCLLEQSEFWHRLDRYLEVCQSTDVQMPQQEKINLLEKKDILYELREIRKGVQAIHSSMEFCRQIKINPQDLSRVVR